MRIHLISRPGPERDAVFSRLPGTECRTFDTPEDFLERAGEEGGLVFLGPLLAGDEALGVAHALAERPGTWLPATLDMEATDGDEPVVRPLSVGFATSLEDILETAGPGEGEGPVLELRSVLRFVARIRHDANNPLTSAMAETQLLLMDASDPEVRGALEVIQAQLRRIRDVVAECNRLRPPNTNGQEAKVLQNATSRLS